MSWSPSMVALTERSWMPRCWATAAMPPVRQPPSATRTISTGRGAVVVGGELRRVVGVEGELLGVRLLVVEAVELSTSPRLWVPLSQVLLTRQVNLPSSGVVGDRLAGAEQGLDVDAVVDGAVVDGGGHGVLLGCGDGSVGERDVERDGVLEGVADRRAADDLGVQLLELLAGARRSRCAPWRRWSRSPRGPRRRPRNVCRSTSPLTSIRRSRSSMPATVALAAYPTARQLPSAPRSCSTGLGAVSSPPSPAGSSDGVGAKSRTRDSDANAPFQVTCAAQVVRALAGSSWIGLDEAADGVEVDVVEPGGGGDGHACLLLRRAEL